MKIPYFHIDAFTDELFRGNPAGVCLLNEWIDEKLMLSIASENRHSETAFIVPLQDDYEIRFFTPQTEVNLCGHATLSAGHVILKHLETNRKFVSFYGGDNKLVVAKNADDSMTLTFPKIPLTPCEMPSAVLEGLSCSPSEFYKSDAYVAVLSTAEQVQGLDPKLDILKTLDTYGIIVTAPGTSSDFVTRFFGPQIGVPEDPGTGVAHVIITPYWAKRLGKEKLSARQLSARGAVFNCELQPDKVALSGNAATYMCGEITV